MIDKKNEEKILSSDFLDELKATREAKNISLDEISEKTNIKKVFIKAIEDGDLDKLPGGVYNKAYIRSISEFLGLSTKQFEKTVMGDESIEGEQLKIQFGKSADSYVPSLLVLIVCVVLIMITYGFFYDDEAEIEEGEDAGDLTEIISPLSELDKQLATQQFTFAIIADKEAEIEFLINDAVKYNEKLEKDQALIYDLKYNDVLKVSSLENISIYLNDTKLQVKDTQLKKGEDGSFQTTIKQLFIASQTNQKPSTKKMEETKPEQEKKDDK